MARGTNIVITAEPRGQFLEGTITDTSVPGTVMEVVPADAGIGGRKKYRAASHAAGAKAPIYVLLPDYMQGKLGVGGLEAGAVSGGVTQGANYAAVGDAYVANTRCFLYAPLMSEELNLVLGDVAGTADSVAIGDLFGVNNNGKLIANSSYTSAPFQAMEAMSNVSADTMLWVQYLGNQA